jgi:uncharacterized DUF497 family protein
MPFIDFIWDLDDDLNGNVQHIAEHGLNKEDVEYVLCNPTKTESSRSSGRPMAFGYTRSGAYIAVVYDEVAEDVVYPVTAFELDED